MARIRNRKLTWKPSESPHVVEYRLYWSHKAPVDYGADYYKLGNVSEVDLSDLLSNTASSSEPIYVGISAVDGAGNESDIVSLPEPCHLKAPAAPMELALTAMDNDVVDVPEMKKIDHHLAPNQTPLTQPNDRQTRQEFLRPDKKVITTEGRITENFGRFLSDSLKE